MSKLKFQSPKGMRDIFGENQEYFNRIYEVVKKVATFYGFKRIETPILEETELFSKGIGLSTDVVKKQMFSLKTRGGDDLTLRPEGTAPIVRAYIENGMKSFPSPSKFWYFGPMFRYENPQAGRFRQFWQFGLETMREASVVRDAEIITIFYEILNRLKIKDLVVEVSSIGDKCCRPDYIQILKKYLKSKKNYLCSDCLKRLKTNPLRILDCKKKKCKIIVSQAPKVIDHLCKNCHKDFKDLLEFLEELEIPYMLNPYLVRGLDYYTKTVFEIFSVGKDIQNNSTKLALGGGGRYDHLINLLGEKREEGTPAVGAALGIDRVMDLMKKRRISVGKKQKPQIFIAQVGALAKRKSLKLMREFATARLSVLEAFGKDSLRVQLKMADKSGVEYTLVLGQKEALDGVILVRNMSTGKQTKVALDKIVEEMKKNT